MAHLLDVRNLEVVYHTQAGLLEALHDVSFNVQPGEIVGIVGESGCGKSTVAAALLRLLPPNGEIRQGKLELHGEDLMRLGRDELRRLRGRDLAMIFQDPMTSLNPVFSVGTQLIDVERAHPEVEAHGTRLRERAIAMLARVGIPDPDERLDRFPHQFSGGMRQRILVAMALMSRPALLIADEPTASLDVTLEAQILELMKELREAYQTAILFVAHDLGVIAQLCDRVIVMYAGRVVEQGDTYALFDRPLHPYTQALLAAVPSRKHHVERLATIPGVVPSLASLPAGCKFVDRCTRAQPLCERQEPDVCDVNSHGGAGRTVRCHMYGPAGSAWPVAAAPTRQGAPAAKSVAADEAVTPLPATALPAPEQVPHEKRPLLALRDVSTRFYSSRNVLEQVLGQKGVVVQAVDGVDLEVQRGEIIGLVGESGSGKTTLGKTILGLVPPARGQILYDGQEITRAGQAERRRLRSHMQMIFQDPSASLSPRLRVSYLLIEPYTIQHIPAVQRYTAAELLRMVGLSEEQAAKYPHELSGGQARRVGIARALALRPEFLIADEPTSGLDVSVAASVLNLMKDLARQLGLTYLVITHSLNVVGYICDRVAVMYLGKLVEVGPTAQIFEAPVHPYTQALLAAISEPDPRQRTRRRLLLKGEIPSANNPPPGCRFHTRCPLAETRCKETVPAPAEIAPGHMVACHRWQVARS